MPRQTLPCCRYRNFFFTRQPPGFNRRNQVCRGKTRSFKWLKILSPIRQTSTRPHGQLHRHHSTMHHSCDQKQRRPIHRHETCHLAIRVGNFRQKNNSAEDGIDRTNGYFRRKSGCSAEQKILEFRSEAFRGRDNNSEFRSVEQKWKEALGIPFRILPKKRKQLGFPFRGTKIKANFPFRTIS
jgi:hypothetical protein